MADDTNAAPLPRPDTPAIGDVVYVRPGRRAFDKMPRFSQANAAIVTGLNSEGSIDVTAFPPAQSAPFPLQFLKHESAAAEDEPAWFWPS